MVAKNSQTEFDYIKQMKSKKIPLSIKVVRTYIKVLYKISKKRAAKLVTKLFLTPQRVTLRSDQLEYYDSGKQEFIQFLDKDVFVFTKGEGPRIMLAHGWGSNSYIFRYLIDQLAEAGYSVVAFDYPAHGQSSGKQTTLVETSELVKHLSELYGPFNSIIAYSFGGPTSIRALELGLKIKNLVLLSAPTNINSIFNPFFDLLDINPVLQDLFIDELVLLSGIDRAKLSPINMNFDKKIRTLIVHDKNDEVIPQLDAELIHKAMRNSKLIITSNLGHRGVPRTESVINEITKFISSSKVAIEI